MVVEVLARRDHVVREPVHSSTPPCFRFRISGFGFWVSTEAVHSHAPACLGFRVSGFGVRVSDFRFSGLRRGGLGTRALAHPSLRQLSGFRFRVSGFRHSCVKFRVSDFSNQLLGFMFRESGLRRRFGNPCTRAPRAMRCAS